MEEVDASAQAFLSKLEGGPPTKLETLLTGASEKSSANSSCGTTNSSRRFWGSG